MVVLELGTIIPMRLTDEEFIAVFPSLFVGQG
jgi:hypothetical protein